MKISTRPRYALRLMLDIFKHSSPGRPVHLREIADRNNLSKGYLEQLVVSLKNAELLRSFSGRGGGYLLARSPEEISLLQVFEATIGPIKIVDCVSRRKDCINTENCECRVLWKLLNYRITHVLADYSLKDLVDGDGVRRMTEAVRRMELEEKK